MKPSELKTTVEGASSCAAHGPETPVELERRVETGKSSGLAGAGGVLDYNELIPPSNANFPWKADDWQLLCYYCNQPIYETKAVAGYRQRTLYMRGRWRHVEGDEWGCDKKLIRPQSEIDPPRCHVCGTQTKSHGGYCSFGGLPRFQAMPMSQKEDEVTRAKSRERTEPPLGGGGAEPVTGTVCDSPKSQNAGVFEMLGRTLYAKVTGHVGCGETDEWCEEVMEEAEKLGLARREVFDPEIHGHDIDAEPGEDVIWTWGFLPEGWQTVKPPVEFLNVMGEPETDPGKCGFLVINDARALSPLNNVCVSEPTRQAQQPKETP